MSSRLRPVLLSLALLLAAPAALAQTLVEVTLVTAIASQLHPVLSWPAGSLRASGSGTTAVIARVPDAHAWTDWEVYTSSGLASRLAPALLQQAETGLAAEGYFRAHQQERQVGGETHTRIEFEGMAGARALLYVVRAGEELVWLLARGR